MRSIILIIILAIPVLAQQSSVPPPPTFSQEKLWGMYGQAVAETKVQQEYIQTLQAKVTELTQKIEASKQCQTETVSRKE